jgi:high-affinity Fe2+/Pb2+ permease
MSDEEPASRPVETFVMGVGANLVSAALIYLIASATGLVTRHQGQTVTTAIAFLVIAWGSYSALVLRDLGKRDANSSSGSYPSPSTLIACVTAMFALVVEVIVLLKHHGGWATTWITVGTVLIAGIPGLVIHDWDLGSGSPGRVGKTPPEGG